MRVLKRLTVPVIVWLCLAHFALSQSIHLTNNQPFPIRLPIEIRDFYLKPAQWTAEGQPAQLDGSNLVLIADLQGSSHAVLNLREGENRANIRFASLEPSSSGISIGQFGMLSWDILV